MTMIVRQMSRTPLRLGYELVIGHPGNSATFVLVRVGECESPAARSNVGMARSRRLGQAVTGATGGLAGAATAVEGQAGSHVTLAEIDPAEGL